MIDFDLDYEINQYIDQEADNFISLENLLSQYRLAYDEALQKTAEFIEKYHYLMEQYTIGQQNLVRLCHDLTARIRQFPKNLDLQYLYFCTVTDTGLLNTINGVQSGEQSIRNYLHQSEQVKNLLAFVQMETECKERLQEVKANLKHTNCLEDTQDFPFLYELTTRHTFLYGAGKNPIYRDNLHSLLLYLNGNDKLKSIKPYLIFAVLSRKHGMMQNRVH